MTATDTVVGSGDYPTMHETTEVAELGAGRAGRPRWLAPDSPVPVYAGVVMIAIGGALVGYTWVRVADLTAVALQLPYLASSGLTGLGLIIVGALAISLAVKRRDATERARQVEELSLLVRALSTALADRAGPPDSDRS